MFGLTYIVDTQNYNHNTWDLSRKEKCDSIVRKWQMYFQASDYKGRNFLELNVNDGVELVRISQVTRRTRQVLKLQCGIIRCHHKLYYYDYKNRRLSRYISMYATL